MNRTLSMVLLAGGVVLMIYGTIAANAFMSDVSRFFKGTPTDKAVWMFIGGLAMSIVGLLGMFRRPGKA